MVIAQVVKVYERQITVNSNFKRLNWRELKLLSEEQLTAYYKELKNYYISLPYDEISIRKQEINYTIIAKLGIPIFKGLFKPEINNADLIPKENGLIFVSNHLGSFDQFPIISSIGQRPIHFLMASTLFTAKEFYRGYLFKGLGAIPVDRKSEDGRKSAQDTMIQIVLHNGNVLYFPEGTRRAKYVDANKLGKFKLGAVSNAQITGAKIVPIAINNDYRLLRSGHLFVNVGNPINVSPLDDLLNVNSELQLRVEKLKDENTRLGAKIYSK